MLRDNTTIDIESALKTIIGLPLSIAREAADMRIFHFGAIRAHPSGRGTIGSHALHIQCSWRFVTATGFVTGTGDRFMAAVDGFEINWDDQRAGNLQRLRLCELLGGFDEMTRSAINPEKRLIVTAVTSDQYAGLDIHFDGDVRLQVFADRSSEENWRFLSTHDSGQHLVVEGACLEWV